MIYLALSILSSVIIMLVFKIIQRFDVPVFPVIVINYGVCVTVGSIANGEFPSAIETFQQPWWPFALFIGVLFITLFNLIGSSIQSNGITVTVIAQRMSVIIPIVAAYFLYQEPFGVMKIIGLILALLAVALSSLKPSSEKKASIEWNWTLLFPLIIFVGSGIIDTTIKYVQEYHLPGSAFDSFLVLLFGTAFAIGALVYVFQLFTGRSKLSTKIILWGVLLGVPNYGSIWFMMKALEAPGIDSSVIFPVNHIGVVSVSAVTALVFFKEKLSTANIIGLLLAGVAIAFIFMG